MVWYGKDGSTYTLSRQLGRGGEGTVYDLQSHTGLVAKIYNEPPAEQMQQKLGRMLSIRSAHLDSYAAWPTDTLHDVAGHMVGFVMRNLSGYVPLHHVFSPMDRKKMFPDKGYNFLVHVARNLATAFYRLHEAGLVVGDVNEGNILVSANGMVAFIDCDSFQVRDGDEYYYCEVGVPRYTPPEFLRRKSFEKVVRTTNTDCFSMAVLLFQLLFLGRHPFAGRNTSSADMDEETAIRLGHFAYSLNAEKKKLTPPPDSLSFADMPTGVKALFHQAFETQERPAPQQWIPVLDDMLGQIATCSLSALHTYPASFAECPWCAFRKQKGIIYFLDDSYIQANAALGNLEHFISTFQAQPLTGNKWVQPVLPRLKGHLAASVRTGLRWRYTVSLVLLLVAFAGSFIHWSWLYGGIAASIIVFRFSPWAEKLRREKNKLRAAGRDTFARLSQIIAEYETPNDLTLGNAALANLTQLIASYRNLPAELERRYNALEEVLYNEQLDDYLRQFYIEDHTIPSISTARKRTLIENGIRNASHIPRLATRKVPGIGPAYEQKLYDWRRQMSAGFVYIPDNYRLRQAREKALEEVTQLRHQLAQKIRTEYQSYNFFRLNISNRSEALRRNIEQQFIKYHQAIADARAIEKWL
jgi:DNA-binding helix-hairpin-helix protein with protein kinase domain